MPGKIKSENIQVKDGKYQEFGRSWRHGEVSRSWRNGLSGEPTYLVNMSGLFAVHDALPHHGEHLVVLGTETLRECTEMFRVENDK